MGCLILAMGVGVAFCDCAGIAYTSVEKLIVDLCSPQKIPNMASSKEQVLVAPYDYACCHNQHKGLHTFCRVRHSDPLLKEVD